MPGVQPATHPDKNKAALKRRAAIIAREIIAGTPTTTALEKAGYSHSYAIKQQSEILDNPVIKSTMTSLLDKAGVTDDRIAGKISTLIDAKTLKYFKDRGTIEVDDNGTQAQMVEFAAKLKGHVVDKAVNLNVNVDCKPCDLSGYGRKVDSSSGQGTKYSVQATDITTDAQEVKEDIPPKVPPNR